MADSDGVPLEWRFTQLFGDKQQNDEITDADVASAIEFDSTGDFLATGDRGGRIVVFERVTDPAEEAESKAASSSKGFLGRNTQPQVPVDGNIEYKFCTEFQSHESEFDCLKSLEIEEKINQIKWLPGGGPGSKHLISTNDKTIKLWKIQEGRVKNVLSSNLDGSGRNGRLEVPRVNWGAKKINCIPRRVYGNAHAYHVNSISLNSDGETFISADDLRVNLWSLNTNADAFNIVDIKPANMEELTEVITSATFHTKHCNLFMFSSSRGSIRLCDMRSGALCDTHSKLFEEEEDPASKSFFSEIISSISDCRFSNCGRYIMSRDYLTLKIWDINMESRPVKTIHIHENLRSRLCDLYENDCIFDKFECRFSGDDQHVITGSYHNMFHIYDRNGRTDTCIEASKTAPKKRTTSRSKLPLGKNKSLRRSESTDLGESINFSKKVLHTAWHPKLPVVAVCALNNMYIYSGFPNG